MTRVTLISTNRTTAPYPVHPLGMACVAAALEAAGHEVAQVDLLAWEGRPGALERHLTEFQPALVGLSMRNMDDCDSLTTVDYAGPVRQLVAGIKARIPVPVVLGGAGFSLHPDSLLAFTGADYGIVGEGEALLVELLEDLAAGRPGARIRRNPAPLDLDRVHAPRYDPALVDFYRERTGLVNLQTKRGCPHHCRYCSYPLLEGRTYRFREPGAVVEDLARLQRDHGRPQVFFTDSVFNDAEGRYLQVAEEILRRGLDVEWACYIRPQGLGRGELALLKRAGLFAAELGTDATTDATLRALGKGFTFEEVVEVNEAFRAERLPCAHFVIFGGPGETPETLEAGLENLRRLRDTVVFAYSGISLFPGAPLLDTARAQGLVSGEWDPRQVPYYHSPALDPARLAARVAEDFRDRRDRFFPPETAMERMALLQRMGAKGILWPRLIRYDLPAGRRRLVTTC